MSATYYLTLTDYGSNLVAQSHNNRNIELLNLLLGDANGQPYNPLDKKNRTSLINQRASVPVQSVEIIDNIARVTATIENHIGGFNIHELGLTDTTGNLVYIGNYHGGLKPVLDAGASGEIELIIDIQAEAGSQVLISISPNIVTANKAWVLNTISASLKTFAETIFHVNSWHGSNNINYDPAKVLTRFFGYETTWVLWPYVPKGVATDGDVLGVISGIAVGNSASASTTRIWQRLEDGASGPTYSLTANKTAVDEGGQVIFTLQTTGLTTGTPVDWTITGIQSDDISPSALSGQFIVDAEGKAILSLDIIEDNKTEGNQTLNLSLTYINGKQVAVVIIDTSQYPIGQQTYYQGSHELIVEANQTITVDMYAPGGGGGGSIYTGGVPDCPGTDGGDVILSFDSNILTVGGGKGGGGGRWGNGSHYFNGGAGAGGKNNIIADSDFNVLIDQIGNTAVIGSRWNRQEGAAGIPSSIGILNGGGAGAWGIGDERWSYGGGGGSGGRVQVQFTNNSEETITMSLVVGERGRGWKNSGNYGDDGGIGFALVTTS
ncbi:phage tail-collar fiber domain-containing protein [Acinetobacter sp. WZC-1]|uniref:phage tail-collar fiber domain-containing protein n=1 Tax=Acinetobacter sp. WZC-1 TaxID=3459034 RepID=UPI00403E22C0